MVCRLHRHERTSVGASRVHFALLMNNDDATWVTGKERQTDAEPQFTSRREEDG